MAESKSLRFCTQFDIKNERCIGDTQRIGRIVNNLMGNAIKFTPEGGVIEFVYRELLFEKPGFGMYELIVADTGIGMNAETVKHIFEPFYRADNSEVELREGTGLGLPIVKNILDLIGGTVDVQSTPGEGSRFIMHIPLKLVRDPSGEPEALQKTQPAKNYDLGGMRILLCEDNELNRIVARRILEKMNTHVTAVENGQRGYETFKNSKKGEFDLILMDLQMPEMNGCESAAAIRGCDHPQAGSIPIVAMSANAFNKDVRDSLEAGMNEHIAKPVEACKLYEKLKKYLPKK